MVDIGVAITLLMKKWVDVHGLTIKEKVAEYITGNQWCFGQDGEHNQHDPFSGTHIGGGRS